MDKKELGPLEEQLFTWEQWGEPADPGSLQFADITLKVDVGEFKAGHKFQEAFWSSGSSTLSLREEDGTIHIFRLQWSRL